MTTRKELEEIARNERKKYEDIWAHPDYSTVSPAVVALPAVWKFFERLNGTFIDFGCGTGRALDVVAQTGKFACLGIDTAENCRQSDAFPFLVCDLSLLPWTSFGPVKGKHCGMCVDVLEHIHPDALDDVLAGISNWAADLCYIRVANFPEGHGPALTGVQLHQILQGPDWWEAVLKRHFNTNLVARLHLAIDEHPPRYSFLCGTCVPQLVKDGLVS